MDRLIVTMPALYRPEILATTLWSFNKGLFRQFSHRTLILNVDPLGVSTELLTKKRRAILALADRYFDEVITRCPEQASFPDAVYWLWSQAVDRGQHFLHLEDDWALNRLVPGSAILALLEREGVASVRLHRQRSLGLAQMPSLSLNPVFMNIQFVSEVLPLFQLDRDPEKQFQFEPLQSRLSHWRHLVIPGPDGLAADRGGWVSDLGVHWRKGRGLEKVANRGQSQWRASNHRWQHMLKSQLLMRFKLLFYRFRLRLNLFIRS